MLNRIKDLDTNMMYMTNVGVYPRMRYIARWLNAWIATSNPELTPVEPDVHKPSFRYLHYGGA